MLRIENTIPKILRHSLSSWYRFRAFWLWFLIGTRSGDHKEAIEPGFRAWIVLEPWFQILAFWEFLQVCILIFCAAWSVRPLGLWFWVCIEAFRSKISIKSSSFDGFCKLIFQDFFISFFHGFWFNHAQISSKLA